MQKQCEEKWRARVMAAPRFARLAFLLCPWLLTAQTGADLKQILERLDHIEQENRSLIEEVRALRKELASSRPAQPATSEQNVEERLAVQERRIEEHAQTKVEASQRFPIRLTGMVLFNAFSNSRRSGGAQNPIVAAAEPADVVAGATLRQTVLGLNFQGPQTFWGGNVRGSLYMDFFGGSNQYNSPSSYAPKSWDFRVRTASLEVDWKTRSLMVGQDKPILAPREPNSLAQVGVSPLSGAGNLWLWQPQIRFEQRLRLSEQTGLRAQVGVFQTSEASVQVPSEFDYSLERSRPALQARIEFSHKLDDRRRFEFAPGFHSSVSHVALASVPSRAVSLDWFANPWEKLEFSGAFFTGRNLANLGALRQGFTIIQPGFVIPVHSVGGWVQLTYLATSRLSFNLLGGQQHNRNSDLRFGEISRNQAYAANLMYRVAPNVVLSLEGAQLRTAYQGIGNRLNNHYDLALAYLF